jgi:hypothetical protein
MRPLVSARTTANGCNDCAIYCANKCLKKRRSPPPLPVLAWAMMLIGFAGLGFAFRQSQRKMLFA